MKIFDVEQLAEADKVTIEKEGITSEILMERAATLVFNEIHSRLQGAKISIKIFCGIGNNGGDGLVIGRLLIENGYNVTIYVVNYSNKRSEDFLANYEKIKEVASSWPILLTKKDDLPDLKKTDFIIDGIFGIGLNRSLDEWVGKLVKHINSSGAFILSVDMPSGLFSEKIPSENDAVIKANFTLSFQAPKLIFFLPQTAGFVGDLQILDIGLDREFLHQAPAKARLIDKNEAIGLYIPRKKNSHKGDYGHSLIIGGSYGKIGSIALAGTAALRTGAGLVTFFSPKCGYQVLQTVLPEAMVITDIDENELSNITFDIEPDVICFGMGAGTSTVPLNAFKQLLQQTSNPMVIDADGLNMLSKEKELLKLLPKNSVLTPHPKELERLIGKWKNDFEKLDKAKKFTTKHKVILVIKGAFTFTISGDEMFINNTGNPGMATAGSGDVLSGVITGLISQKYDPLNAAVFGVYLHGRAGDIMADEKSYQGMISGDIAANIGRAFLDLFKIDSQME
ncbi:NAD(P)H-hydrate dehydratase [Gillisia sp. Q332]|uniref:NAD(P)H-hydrate dehydratase n=1 Tax=Gillisia xinjiangensis TaxID=3384765 RepID=UPI00391A1AB3